MEIFIFYIKKEEISLGSINNTNQKSNGNMSKEEFEIVKIGCGTMYKGNQIYLYLCYSLCYIIIEYELPKILFLLLT